MAALGAVVVLAWGLLLAGTGMDMPDARPGEHTVDAGSLGRFLAVLLMWAVGRWREDFEEFRRAIRAVTTSDGVASVPRHETPRLFIGWCTGDQRFREVDLGAAV